MQDVQVLQEVLDMQERPCYERFMVTLMRIREHPAGHLVDGVLLRQEAWQSGLLHRAYPR